MSKDERSEGMGGLILLLLLFLIVIGAMGISDRLRQINDTLKQLVPAKEPADE